MYFSELDVLVQQLVDVLQEALLLHLRVAEDEGHLRALPLRDCPTVCMPNRHSACSLASWRPPQARSVPAASEEQLMAYWLQDQIQTAWVGCALQLDAHA